MKIAVLTSSRADFGIYLPLLRLLKEDATVELSVIAFGSHLSPHHGYTLDEIKAEGFKTIHTISSLLLSDTVESIATAYGMTTIKFAEYWRHNKYDVVLCLGDRYEMAAAVQAGIPFGVNFCHLHGGETTLGAIDNIYRHQITLASSMHFASTQVYAERIVALNGDSNNVYHTGALSLDGVEQLQARPEQELRNAFELPEGPFILVTFHPETVNYHLNTKYAVEMRYVLGQLSKNYAIVVTMPNADTLGSVYRKELNALQNKYPERIKLIEHFGKHNYFSAMQYATILLGNTSSGIVEAASFSKYVVNVGDRQAGRAQSDNILNAEFKADEILEAAERAIAQSPYKGSNIYYKPDAATYMQQHLKQV